MVCNVNFNFNSSGLTEAVKLKTWIIINNKDDFNCMEGAGVLG